MCGISGILRFDPQLADPAIARRMTDAMAHRGPDADGFFNEDAIALGHRRLSIIDLSTAANQPLFDNSGRYAIVFNGEMYNFNEVKSGLRDYDFRTNGDTEVLLAAFAKEGPACINRFKGMFAFALWDRLEKTLYLVRDRMGVKPLYYYADDTRLAFASEIRSLLASGWIKPVVSPEALKSFFSYQSVGFPETAIEGIRQVEAGCYLVVKDGTITSHKYWDITKSRVDFDFSDTGAVHRQIRHLMTASVSNRMVSDVPVGAFLSGGIDSSAIVGLMAEVSHARPNTFTIAFDETAFDESAYAELVATRFNTTHEKITLKPTVFLDELENALQAMDSPSADGVNTYVVSKAIRKAGITVALSGVGGDELFAGYPFFKQYLQLRRKDPVFRYTGALRKTLSGIMSASGNGRTQRTGQIVGAPSASIEYSYPVSRQILTPSTIRKLTRFNRFRTSDTSLFATLDSKSGYIAEFPLLSQVSIADYLGYTQHTLLKDTDQMSMANSLEVREPFFDHDLVEFILSVPDDLKYPAIPKGLLVNALHPLLPDQVVHRKKQGFVFPWEQWMKRELRSFCEERVRRLAQRGFINGSALMQFWQNFLQGDKSIRWPEVWIFVVLEYWLDKNNVNS